MPFNVGPFEIIVAAVVIGGFLLLITSKQRAGRPPQSEEARLASRSLDELVAEGWRIESESTEYVFLVKGRPVNHLLHFFVGIFTLGVWWIVWILVAANGGERRHTVKR